MREAIDDTYHHVSQNLAYPLESQRGKAAFEGG
jgi:hypothetical protein